MKSYLRPLIDPPVFRDADGLVIDFGNRWEGHPPDEMYSVDSHPERFQPIHTVADALIAHLRDAYDVELTEGAPIAADLLRPAPEVLRAVRVRPNDPRCAPLTFVFTNYPGIFLHAGLLHDFPYPLCGCEACDSSWGSEADDLEHHVLAVVGGTTGKPSITDQASGWSMHSAIRTERHQGDRAHKAFPQTASTRRSPSSTTSAMGGPRGRARRRPARDRHALVRSVRRRLRGQICSTARAIRK